jgi:hypothetical protein
MPRDRVGPLGMSTELTLGSVSPPLHAPSWRGSIRKGHTAAPHPTGPHRPCPTTPGQLRPGDMKERSLPIPLTGKLSLQGSQGPVGGIWPQPLCQGAGNQPGRDWGGVETGPQTLSSSC